MIGILAEGCFDASAEEVLEERMGHCMDDEVTLERDQSVIAAILEATADGVVVIDLSGQATVCNSKFREMWHLPQEAVNSAEDQHLIASILQQVGDTPAFISDIKMRNGQDWESFDTIQFVDGRYIQVVRRSLYHNGSITGRVFTFKDVTRSIRTESTLLKVEAEIAALFENAPLMMVALDQDRKVCRLTRRALEIAGCDQAGALQMRAGELFGCVHWHESREECGSGPSCDSCGLRHAIEDSIATGRVYTGVQLQTTEVGGIDSKKLISLAPSVRISVSSQPLVLAWLDIGNGESVTPLDRQGTKGRCHLGVGSDCDVIVNVDLNGFITYLSPAVEHVLGFTPDDPTGKAALEFELKPCVMQMFKSLPAPSQRPHVVEAYLEALKKDGTLTAVHAFGMPILHGDGLVAGQFVLRHTPELQLLADRELLSDQLQFIARAIGRAGNDFNNMLTPVSEYTSWIIEELSQRGPAMECANEIARAVKHMAEISRELISMGRRELTRLKTINLNDIVEQVANSFKPTRPDIEIKTVLVPDVHPIFGDPSQLYQALLNVIVNSAEALLHRGTISVQTENKWATPSECANSYLRPGPCVKVTIVDTGCGMSNHIRGRAFEPFFTTKTSKRRRASGLGLNVVQTVVSNHSGIMELNSTVRSGTTVTIILPAISQ